MKRFLQKLLLYILIVAFISASSSVLFFTVVTPQYKNNFNASAADKIARLESLGSPKIILVGNSNVAFGFDSEMLEAATGMPVVNLGLHGGLENAFHEKMARYNIGNDDLVIVMHSNYADNSKISDYSLAWITIEDNFHLLRCLDIRDIWGMLCTYPDYVNNCLNRCLRGTGNNLPDGWYSRTAFNQYGDIAVDRPKLSYTFTASSVSVPAINDTCTNRLNDFHRFCMERGAHLLIAGYPIASGEFTPPASEYSAFQQNLEKKLDCAIISDFTDYFIPYEYFLDTHLHLNDAGVKIRTQQLIEDIQNWQRNQTTS